MVLVKICGITNLKDGLAAPSFGADMVGFNFYPKSPRYINPISAGAIASRLPREVKKVGVFVNESIENINAVCNSARLDMIQLHGDESEEFVDQIRSALAVPVIKAIRIGDPDIEIADTVADAVLLDAYSPDKYGGTGETFEWEKAVELKSRFSKIYLAGGLTPDNVAEAVSVVSPFAVDVAGGVEVRPGIKDILKMKAFIENAKKAI
ncbi:MAG: phosphoribosylanthranilate isomerase [Acidobacteria bacterium]|nr:phosphoribosylanthranilate isomerase [Acidobacteriota bacterium]